MENENTSKSLPDCLCPRKLNPCPVIISYKIVRRYSNALCSGTGSKARISGSLGSSPVLKIYFSSNSPTRKKTSPLISTSLNAERSISYLLARSSFQAAQVHLYSNLTVIL